MTEQNWKDFYKVEENTPSIQTPQKQEKLTKEEIEKIINPDITCSKSYIKVIFTKGKYKLAKLTGQTTVFVRKNKLFGSVKCPNIKLIFSKKKFIGWFTEGKKIENCTPITEEIILTPEFE